MIARDSRSHGRTQIRNVLVAVGIGLVALAQTGLEPQIEAAGGHPDTLKIAVLDNPKTFNYLNILTSSEMAVIDLVYEPMTDPDTLTLEPAPLLAQEWEWDTSTLTCKVQLRENATWHDGTTFSAEDVKFWFDALKEMGPPKFAAEVACIESVRVVGRSRVDFVLKEPRATLPFGFLMMSKHRWSPLIERGRTTPDPLAYLLEQKIRPVGCGVFKFGEETPNSVYLEANEDYYLGGPLIDGVLFTAYDSMDAAISALDRGQVDYVYRSIEPRHIDRLKKNRNISIRKNPTKEFYYLAFNLRRSPLHDLAFRKAVALLVDREFIAEEVFAGSVDPLYAVVPESFTFWHNPGVPEYGRGMSRAERAAQAKSILTDAGYGGPGTDLMMPNGHRMGQIEIVTPTPEYDRYRARIGTLLAEWLEELGVETRLTRLSLMDITEKMFAQDFDILILGWDLPLGPCYLYTLFHSSNAVKGGFNIFGYSNPQFDELIKREQSEPDRDRRRQLVFRAQEMIAEDLPCLPLYSGEMIEAYRNDRFEGWVDMVGGILNRWSFARLHSTEDKDHGM